MKKTKQIKEWAVKSAGYRIQHSDSSILRNTAIIISILGIITLIIAFGYRTYLEFFASCIVIAQQPRANKNINNKLTQSQEKRFLIKAPVVDKARIPHIIIFPLILTRLQRVRRGRAYLSFSSFLRGVFS